MRRQEIKEYPFDILWVAEKCGLLTGKIRRSGGEVNIRCPLPGCGDKGTHLALNLVKNVWNCPHCGRGGGMIDLYAQLGRSSQISRSDATRELFALWRGEHGDDLEDIRRRDEQRKARMAEIAAQAPREVIAPIEVRHTAYQTLLDHLSGVIDEHMENLLGRGLTQADIERLGLKSFVFPKGKVLRAPRKLDTYGVAGFYTGKDGRRYVNTDIQGLMIPYRDLQGRIGMIEIRAFEGKTRYLRFASGSDRRKSRTGKTKSVSTVHHVGIDLQNPPAKVYLTEGGLKADVANALSGLPFIAVAGVNNPSGLKKALRGLKDIGVQQICVAFDMDLYKNPNVLRGLRNVWSLIQKSGLAVSWAKWPPEFKGIDDFLWYKAQAEAGFAA